LRSVNAPPDCCPERGAGTTPVSLDAAGATCSNTMKPL
jgi:hypothetical protein